jgi:hypothetical protein
LSHTPSGISYQQPSHRSRLPSFLTSTNSCIMRMRMTVTCSWCEHWGYNQASW